MNRPVGANQPWSVADNRTPATEEMNGGDRPRSPAMNRRNARDFVASAPGRFLVRALPFENRERRNDTHELLYFRDSRIHRRLIERTVTLGRGDGDRLGSNAIGCLRVQRVESYVPKRWEAFVVTTVIDLVGDRCRAFAYRYEETREIALVLEWADHTPPER